GSAPHNLSQDAILGHFDPISGHLPNGQWVYPLQHRLPHEVMQLRVRWLSPAHRFTYGLGLLGVSLNTGRALLIIYSLGTGIMLRDTLCQVGLPDHPPPRLVWLLTSRHITDVQLPPPDAPPPPSVSPRS